MASLQDFFSRHAPERQKGIEHKNNLIKRDIITLMVVNGLSTLAELTQKLNVSIPTVTKLVGELIEDGLVVENGKIETSGGRRPIVYGLTSTAVYFAGVNIERDFIIMVITDIRNNIIVEREVSDFKLEDTQECLDAICGHMVDFIDTCGVDKDKILAIGVCITGRVNPFTGRCYKYFTWSEQSLIDVFEQATGIDVMLENNTRSKCYAEYITADHQDGKNVIYLHLGRGVAIGMVIDGKLYYGKSGFSGELGHTPFFDNEKICDCGKKGCLETEISGIAIEDKFVEKLNAGSNSILRPKYERTGEIYIDEIVEAALRHDNLSIELIEEAGKKVGKSVAFLINIFNPETVVVGGNLSAAGDYLMLPLKAATNKHSLNFVYKDTRFRLSQMGLNAGALGAAMLARNNIIGSE